MKAVVIMAVRNGELYLEEALESIINQSICPDQVIIGDDNSTDASMDIIFRYCLRFDFISLVERSSQETLGVVSNFSRLAEVAVRQGADIILFADQDDVWSEKKLEVTLQAFSCFDVSELPPVLFHSDLRVVDRNLEVISESYFSYTRLPDPRTAPHYRLYAQNNVTGCAAACTPNLLKVALPFPSEAVMHDWWLALVCESIGTFKFTDRALVDYRQHSTNVLGAREAVERLPLVVALFRLMKNMPALLRHFVDCHEQLVALCSRLKLHGIKPSDNLLQWCTIVDKSFVGRAMEGGIYANNPNCPYERMLIGIIVGITPLSVQCVRFWRKLHTYLL